ncbi:hypothetical protein SAMD00023353_2000200 [Rosellinia necatrix]|uniref:Uncharacterized protein n=1 Tax=Rosellinia necatrix TaxID=77044 RepID=A0A1S8A7H9_ROSNE|nr:hypothetical protein SAMD00023353_2000200 [Rosellinia necatrix]
MSLIEGARLVLSMTVSLKQQITTKRGPAVSYLVESTPRNCESPTIDGLGTS